MLKPLRIRNYFLWYYTFLYLFNINTALAADGMRLQVSLLLGLAVSASSISALQNKLAEEPENPALRYQLARELDYAGLYAEALEQYQQLLERYKEGA